jgi:hypothetical protein
MDEAVAAALVRPPVALAPRAARRPARRGAAPLPTARKLAPRPSVPLNPGQAARVRTRSRF